MMAEPAVTPCTTPPLTVATATLLLIQVPPAVPLEVSVMEAPVQTLARPEIVPAVAAVLIVSDLVATAVAQLEATE